MRLTGFIETRRVGGGGFRLARPAERVTIGAVVRAAEATLAEAARTPRRAGA